MSDGWVRIHRKIFDNPDWLREPFTSGQAWIDLILLANYKDGFLNIQGARIPIKRGQIGWSQERLSTRWQWSRGKVKRYLLWLENVHQIVQSKTSKISLITLINYDEYQTDDTADSTADGHPTVQPTDTNNKVKKEKKVNNVEQNHKKTYPDGSIVKIRDITAVKKFGTWMDADNPNVRIDLTYYSEFNNL